MTDGRASTTAIVEHGLVLTLSFSLLILEVTLTKLMTIQFYYSYTFVVITAAIAGSGLGAGLVFFFQRTFVASRFATIVAVSLTALIGLSATWYIPVPLVGRVLLGGASFAAFGVIITFVFKVRRGNVYRLYFSNIFGASLGALALPFLFRLLGLERLLFAIILLLTALLVVTVRRVDWRLAVALLVPVALLLARAGALTSPLPCAPHDAESYGEQVRMIRWNELSRVDVSNQPTYIERSLSTRYTGARTTGLPCSIDCLESKKHFNYSSIITDFEHLESLRYELSYLPHHLISDGGAILLIGAGGGKDIVAANLEAGEHSITAVEMNPLIPDIMREHFPETFARVFEQPNIHLVIDEIRSFLARDTGSYDLIELPIVKTQPSLAAGHLKYERNNLYTIEALEAYLEHLRDRGLLTVTWYNQQPFFLKLVATLHRIAGDVTSKVAVIENGDFALLIFKKDGLSDTDLSTLGAVTNALGFGIVYARDVPGPVAERYRDHASGAGVEFHPAVDDRPFFYDYDPGRGLGFVLLALLGSMLALAGLFVAGRRVAGVAVADNRAIHLYFAGLGCGYIVMELFFIEKLTLFVGQPLYGFSLVLVGLLGFNALGCVSFQRLGLGVRWAFAVAAGMLLLYAVGLDPMLGAAVSLPLSARLAVALALLLPVGWATGIPFAWGLEQVAGRSTLTPYAWVVNALSTVVGMASSLVVASWLGYRATAVLACLLYSFAWYCSTRLVLIGGTQSDTPRGTG